MKYILISLLLIFSSISAKSYLEEKIEKQLIESIFLPALQMEQERNDQNCDLNLANQCFSTLHELFADCKQAIEDKGKDINSDILCLKAIWNLRNTDMKDCIACTCEFAEHIKIKLPFCKKEEMIMEGMNIFEQLLLEN